MSPVFVRVVIQGFDTWCFLHVWLFCTGSDCYTKPVYVCLPFTYIWYAACAFI